MFAWRTHPVKLFVALTLFFDCLVPPVAHGDDETATPTATPTETPTPAPTETPTATPCTGETRYWVGGTGTWEDSAHWSCVSGGSGGAPVPECVSAGDTYQGASDCVWDEGSGLNEGFSDLFSSGLCCRTADWTAVTGVLNESNPQYSFYEARARFTDGFIISGSMKANWGIGFHWGAGPVYLTANSGTHDLLLTTDIPVGNQLDGGLNFHGTGTYGDDATWNLVELNTFNGPGGYAAQSIVLGYGTLLLNGERVEAWEFRNGHPNDPQDSFTLDAGTGPDEWSNALSAGHLWSLGSNFVAGNSNVWCGGIGYTWSNLPCTFDGGGANYHTVAAAVRAGNEYIVTGDATIERWDVFTQYCGSWQCDPEAGTPAPATMTVAAGSSLTVADWSVAGGDGRPLMIRSSESGEPWTVNCTDSICQSDYLFLSDSICTGNTPCYAGDHSTVDEFSLAHGWVIGAPPPPTGCCQFTGNNMLGATCVDNHAFFNDTDISMDYCEALAAQFFHSDEVMWFNPNATCDPAPGSFQGVCPPLDPSTPTPTPAASGCCVFDSECSIPPEAGFEPIPVSGGLCADSTLLGGQVLSDGRCGAGATALGCTKVRFIANGTCDTDCSGPVTPSNTPTPTPTPTATVAPGCCQFTGNNMLGMTCIDRASFLGGNAEVSFDYCQAVVEQFFFSDSVEWFNPDATCDPAPGSSQGMCPPLNPSTPTPTPIANGCCVVDSECSIPPEANLQPIPVTGGLCIDSSNVNLVPIIGDGRCTAGANMLGCTKVRFIAGGNCASDCVPPTDTPTPTPTPIPPGCCQFTGNNMLGMTCIDRASFLGGNAEVSFDYCQAVVEQFFFSDSVEWFNPDATCDPAPGSSQGMCPPLNPSTPTPTPIANGCCVVDSECSIPPEANLQPIPVTGGLCIDSSNVNLVPIIGDGRCTAGANMLGCTKVRFVAGGTCDTDCATPTPTSCGTTRYWVGGAGNADDPTHWSCTSGGEAGASVPECVEAGDTFQGTNDCVWDESSGFADNDNIWSTGLCCHNASWPDVPQILETSDPQNQYWRARAMFTDGFIISASITMGSGIGFHWGANQLVMTANSGSHTFLFTELPIGNMTNGGVDFHGTGTSGDDATWSQTGIGGFDGRIGWGHKITFGYGTVLMNGFALQAEDLRSGHDGQPSASFTFDAGSAAPTNGWPPNNVINAYRSWSTGSTFIAGTSTVWCGGIGGTWGHGTCTFDGGGQTYFNVAAAVSPGRQYIIEGNATVTSELRVFTHPCQGDECDAENDPAATMLVAAGSTQTVAGWNVAGNQSQRLVLGSTTAQEPWTLNCTAQHCISDYIDLTDSICSGHTPCYAGLNSTADAFSLAHGWSLDPPPTATPTNTFPPGPTNTPRPNNCATGDNLCGLDDSGGCGDCRMLHIPSFVEHCVAEIACINAGTCGQGGGGTCTLGEECSAALVDVCYEECRCIPTPTPTGSPTLTGSYTPTIEPTPLPAFVEFESGQVRPLALSPDGDRLFAVNTPDNRLEIFNIDETTGDLTPLASVPVGLEPVAVAARSDNEVWVVNHLSDSVSIVSLPETGSPQVTRTLLVGDEPRDIVFAGSPNQRAFITAAHRGQNAFDADNLDILDEGLGRADVWVFNPGDLGDALGGTPVTRLSLFSDTPRALAVSADASTVYAAAFHSGNRTTAVSAGMTTSWKPGVDHDACMAQGVPDPACFINNLPEPQQEDQPLTSLIVKQRDGNNWLDRACASGSRYNRFCTTDDDCTDGEGAHACGNDWSSAVRFNLPDQDVFAINANANPPETIASYPGVGTILFNMAVNPVNGKVYVTNTDADNDVRFEGNLDLGDPDDSSVRGNLHKARVTVIDGSNVLPRHLNKHITYAPTPAPTPAAAMRAKSLAQPTGIVVNSDGNTAYIAAFGSQKVGIFSTSALEDDSFVPNSANQVPLSAGGPSGLVLHEGRNRLYVMTRFDNGISSIDINTKQEVEHHTLYNPEPDAVTEGRHFFYDADFSSANGESSCASCHVFGDFDSLAWDLGDPDGNVVGNPNPQLPGIPLGPPFHNLKGPMTTQTLRGLRDNGAMHWRGDRTGAGEAADPFDAFASFMKFRGAFQSLLGRVDEMPVPDMEDFTRFILEVTLPPNPIRKLNNSLTAEQLQGANFFFGNRSDGGTIRCDGCHTIDPSRKMFGTNRGSVRVGTQSFKIPGFRNLYQKVGMFGLPQLMTPAAGVDFNTFNAMSTDDQVRGFGYLHDGSVDDLLRFVNAKAFNQQEGQPEGFHMDPEGDEVRRGVAMYLLAADTNLMPIVGQQVTLAASPPQSVTDRIALLLQRCGDDSDCDLVVKATIDGEQHGWVLEPNSSEFRSDLDEIWSDSDLRNLALTQGQLLTYTAVPRGSGRRIGIDRDLDNVLDGNE